MTEEEKSEFIGFLTKCVENNDGNSIMHIVNETYYGKPQAILLTRLAATSQALTNSEAFNFYVKYSRQPMLLPNCICCGDVVDGQTNTAHPDVPSVVVCARCKAYGSIGKKIESDKQRVIDSLNLLIEESKAQCGETEEGCVRCNAVNDVNHLMEALKCIKR